MDELKERTMEVIDNINKGWIDTIKVAEEKQEGIDMTVMMGKYSEHLKKLDQCFRECSERIKRGKNKSKWSL